MMGHERADRRPARVIRFENPDSRNLRLIDKMTETVLQHENAKTSACTIADEWLTEVEAENPNLAFSVEVMRSALPYIQTDTIGELSAAYNLYLHKDESLSSTRSQLRLVTNFSGLEKEDRGRFSLALLAANLFNREDEKIEKALQHGAHGTSVQEGEIITNVLESGAATLIKREDANIRISPHDYLVHLARLVRHEGLESQTFQKYVDVIVAAQVRGLSMLEKEYSPAEAAVYKLSTVSMYHQLVGSLMFKDYERADKYRHYLMGYQLNDDEDDIREDVNIQPNPFVALLRRYDMLDEFLQSKLSYKKFLKRKKDSFTPESGKSFDQEMRDFEAIYYSRDMSLVQTFINSPTS